MLTCFSHSSTVPAVSLTFIEETAFSTWLPQQTDFVQQWVTQQTFLAKPDTFCIIPKADGKIATIIIGAREKNNPFYLGHLATILPQGIYTLTKWDPVAALAWGMGAYQFTRYKAAKKNPNQLLLPEKENHASLFAQLRAIYLIRDLVNTPAEDMGPAQLASAAAQLAKEFGAYFQQIVGDDLLHHHYPAIHAVGRASAQAPRLIELRWGNPSAPKLTLVGKGVCFDSGGLDIKTAANMALMKKDMGGAAHILGLALLIMDAKLPVNLRVLIPAVENSIAGNAYRPGDIIKTRKGLTVEIGNTDAEGRVILSDALAEAASEKPELIIDMATLTGAARIALGTELPAFFTDNDQLAIELSSIGKKISDPLWRLPLHTPYRKLLDSPIADLNNATSQPYGGAITAALFLKEFIERPEAWIHFDIMGWNLNTTPAHPEGADAVAIRTLFTYLQQRFTSAKK